MKSVFRLTELTFRLMKSILRLTELYFHLMKCVLRLTELTFHLMKCVLRLTELTFRLMKCVLRLTELTFRLMGLFAKHCNSTKFTEFLLLSPTYPVSALSTCQLYQLFNFTSFPPNHSSPPPPAHRF